MSARSNTCDLFGVQDLVEKLTSYSSQTANYLINFNPEEVYEDEINIGDTIFRHRGKLFKFEMDDYTVISNRSILHLKSKFPPSIKQALNPRWIYSLAVSRTNVPPLTSNELTNRVMGGQLLAYKYLPVSIDANVCMYYGILPIKRLEFDAGVMHRKARFCMKAQFPRSMFVFIEHMGTCLLHQDCIILASRSYENTSSNIVWCSSNNIPLNKMYVMMGDLSNMETLTQTEVRECNICANCYKCSISSGYCKSHKKCRHKIKTDMIKSKKIKRLSLNPNVKIK